MCLSHLPCVSRVTNKIIPLIGHTESKIIIIIIIIIVMIIINYKYPNLLLITKLTIKSYFTFNFYLKNYLVKALFTLFLSIKKKDLISIEKKFIPLKIYQIFGKKIH